MTRLLIADDHLLFRECLKSILKSETDLVVTAEAGSLKELLEILSSETVDFITLDLTMSDVSGMEAIRQIRKINKKIPVLVISMHPEDRFAMMSIKMGASGYITKEKSPEELVNAIRRILAGGKYMSRNLETILSEEFDEILGDSSHNMLSDREYEIFIEIASGKKASEIALEHGLSTSTVNSHRTRILDKMKLKSNVDITYYAMKHNLIE